ncbi:DUF1446 domain-containing protein [Colletotrichum tofieldiae]|nr:DUF1446 domain-containing protein [Colletotrichum tofieldiae]GKT79159.1 DUF1446 domain-containing protein [Colletotrichum tofieldiae]
MARIASASGSAADRRHGLAELARDEDIHYIVGDWMSEYNMALRGGAKAVYPTNSSEFEPSFLEAIEPALEHLDARQIRIAVNAGASDTKKLHDILVSVISKKGLKLRVAWVEGDEVIEVIQKGLKTGEGFKNLTTGANIKDWSFEPIYAQAYLGCWGIVEAFRQGAHIVLCGRVADASPTIACAAYHHGWRRNDYSQLAHALVAGHFIECTTYITGGNFSGFKGLPGASIDIGFPIAQIEATGEFSIYKQAGKDGMVTIETCKAQLLYEIQGPYYYNSDVVAILDNIKMTQVGKDKVYGIRFGPGTAAFANFRTNGSCPENPTNQDAATVELRIFAQARDDKVLSPMKFLKPIVDNMMQSYPGATLHLDTRQAFPKEYYEYWVSIIPQSATKHVCHLPWKSHRVEIAPPSDTVEFMYEQPTYETKSPINLASLGPVTKAPLGYVVHARSGDKGSDSNVGFFVRNADEWDWLRSLLTVSKIKELLEEDDKGKPIFRFELPHLFGE